VLEKTMTAKPLYRYADGRLPNTLATLYTALAYGGGLALLFAGNGWLNALGTLKMAPWANSWIR
jgi:hypothetical protein